MLYNFQSIQWIFDLIKSFDGYMRINFSCFISCIPKVKILFILATSFLTSFTQTHCSKVVPSYLGCPPLELSDFILEKMIEYT